MEKIVAGYRAAALTLTARAAAPPAARERLFPRVLLAALIALAVETVAARQNTSPAAKAHLALVGGMLIDGYNVPPVHHAAVLIEGNLIVAAGPASEIDDSRGATVIDTTGRTMLPGLIEAHAHLDILGHGNYDRWYPWTHAARRHRNAAMEISAKQLLTRVSRRPSTSAAC